MRQYSAKETCNFIDPTHCSHPIPTTLFSCQIYVVVSPAENEVPSTYSIGKLKEPYIQSKEPYVLSKEPYISRSLIFYQQSPIVFCQKSPVIFCQMRPIIFCRKSPIIFCQKSPISPIVFCQKSPVIFCQMRPIIFCQKSPITFCQKSPISSQTSHVFYPNCPISFPYVRVL